MVKIRLQREGKKKAPFYHIVVADSRSPRDGKIIEQIGTYDPMTEPSTIVLNKEKLEQWMKNGAQPTETVKALFVSTDGLFKSFASEEDFLKYHGLLSHMFHDTEKMQKSLKRNFEKRTREGSGDDISIAFVYQEGEEAEWSSKSQCF